MNPTIKQLEAQVRAGAQAAQIMAEALERALGVLREAGMQLRGLPTKAALKTEPAGDFVTKEELRQHLNLPNVKAVERLMREKKIPFHKWGYRTTRFKVSEVEQALASFQVRAASTR